MKGYDPLKLFATVCMVILVFASLATAAQFQADVVESREVETRKGHIWYKDGIYRLQMEHSGDPKHYLLVNTETRITQMVFPKYKAYLETSGDDFMILMNEDPFQAAELTAKSYQLKIEGREALQGQDCERQLVYGQGGGILRRWMAPELGFPVKIEFLLQDDWYTVLQHIKRGEVLESDFQVPETYAQKTKKEMTRIFEADPEAIAKKKAYHQNRPRKSDYNDFLRAGETWHLVVPSGTKIRLEAKPIGSSHSVTWFAVPYKGKTPLKTRDESTHQGQAKVKFDPELGVDRLDLGVMEGELSIKIILIGKMPHIQAMRKVLLRHQNSGSSWGIHGAYQFYQVQITSLENHKAGVRFAAAGKKHDLTIPAGAQRKFTFRPEDKVSDLNLAVDYGKVEVLCIQENRSEAELHAACLNDKRAPWCYEEKIVAMQKPELCANISRYWGAKAGGVEGYCYYEIAKQTRDCSLCKEIKDRRMRQNLCHRDVCRKNTGRSSRSARTSKK